MFQECFSLNNAAGPDLAALASIRKSLLIPRSKRLHRNNEQSASPNIALLKQTSSSGRLKPPVPLISDSNSEHFCKAPSCLPSEIKNANKMPKFCPNLATSSALSSMYGPERGLGNGKTRKTLDSPGHGVS